MFLSRSQRAMLGALSSRSGSQAHSCEKAKTTVQVVVSRYILTYTDVGAQGPPQGPKRCEEDAFTYEHTQKPSDDDLDRFDGRLGSL